MSKCFVIQPFNLTGFEKRYNEILKPAINDAGFEEYRVDEDLNATILIDAIEKHIEEASVCLADISEDNPNVWFELGYARAARRPVVMICSKARRTELPFDIRHHVVIFYDSDSTSDFENLKSEICQRLRAAEMQFVESHKPEKNLNQSYSSEYQLNENQVLLLAALTDGLGDTGGTVTSWSLRQSGKNYGLHGYDIEVEFRTLMNLGILEIYQESDDYESYEALRITDYGIKCMKENRNLFNAIANQKITTPPPATHDLDDEIPF